VFADYFISPLLCPFFLNTDNTLDHQVYRKWTHTDTYTESHHHSTQKQSAINSLVHKAFAVSENIYR